MRYTTNAVGYVLPSIIHRKLPISAEKSKQNASHARFQWAVLTCRIISTVHPALLCSYEQLSCVQFYYYFSYCLVSLRSRYLDELKQIDANRYWQLSTYPKLWHFQFRKWFPNGTVCLRMLLSPVLSVSYWESVFRIYNETFQTVDWLDCQVLKANLGNSARIRGKK